MTHPALEARARGALKPLADDRVWTVLVQLRLPADLIVEICKASCLASTSTNQLIEDILLDNFPVEAPR